MFQIRNSKAVLALSPAALAAASFLQTLPVTASAADAPAAAASAAEGSQQVVVTGIRASKERSLNAKRAGEGVSEVVSAEDIGKLPDKNVADALQRLPGVTTMAGTGGQGGYDENDRVSMRGTGPSLSLTTINGHGVATADWDPADQLAGSGAGAARSVSFLLLPSEIVSQVVVAKSAQADQVEGGVAGTVDIRTRRPLDFKEALTLEAGLQGVYSDLAKKTDPQFNALFNWRNDARTFGLMLQAFDETRHVRRDGIKETWGTIAASSAAAQQGAVAAGTTYLSEQRQVLFTQERQRTGGVVDVQWKPLDSLTINLDGFRSQLKAHYVDSEFVSRYSNSVNGGVVPTGTTVSNGVLTGATFANTGSATGAQLETYVNPKAVASTQYLDLDADWHPTDRLAIGAKVGKSTAVGDSYLYSNYLFFPNTTTGYVVANTSQPATALLPNGVSAANATENPGNSGADQSYSLQHSLDTDSHAQVDGSFAFNAGALSDLKFGLRETSHLRRATRPLKGGLAENAAQNGQVANTTLPLIDVGSGTFGNGLPLVSADTVVSWSQANLPTNAVFNKPVSGEFSVKEHTRAGYLMADLDGDHWRGNVGVRAVRTLTAVTTNTGLSCGVPSATNGITFGSQAQADACASSVPAGATLTIGSRFGNFYTKTTDGDYTDILPSANLSLDVTKNLVLRAGAAKVMARPDYGALGATISGFAWNGGSATPSTATGGNPTLGPVRAKNFNLGAEWYYAPQALLSAQLFYMHFDSLIGAGFTTQYLLNTAAPGGPQYADTVVASPVATTGRSKGLELGWQQPVWGGFGVDANYTYVDALEADKLPILGASKNSYSAGAFFENDAFNARVVYSHRSRFRVGLYGAAQNYEAATGTLAASADYNLDKHVSLTLEGLNLNDPQLRYYSGSPATPNAFYKSGRQVYAGVRVKF